MSLKETWSFLGLYFLMFVFISILFVDFIKRIHKMGKPRFKTGSVFNSVVLINSIYFISLCFSVLSLRIEINNPIWGIYVLLLRVLNILLLIFTIIFFFYRALRRRAIYENGMISPSTIVFFKDVESFTWENEDVISFKGKASWLWFKMSTIDKWRIPENQKTEINDLLKEKGIKESPG